MKFRNVLFLILLALAGFGIAMNPTLFGVCGWLALVMVTSAFLSRDPQQQLLATLSATEILQDTLDALKVQVPFLTSAFSTDFQTTAARKGDTIIMHIAGLPTTQSYDATSGYQANGAEASSLISDVSLALDQHTHFPVKLDYIDAISSRKALYNKVIANQAYAMGKAIVDFALGKATAANITHGTVMPSAAFTYDSLEAIRTALNTQGAAPMGRFGIVSSALSAAMASDVRCTSRDYYGQTQGQSTYRHFRGVAGFENIWEYPSFPVSGAGTANGVFGDSRLIGIATRLPQTGDAEALGVPNIASFETVQDPDTGLSLLGIKWQHAGTFDLWMTITCLFGATVGTAGGAADSKTDKAGYRTTES